MKSLITLALSLLVSTSAFSYTQKCEEMIRDSITFYKNKMQGVTDKGNIQVKYTWSEMDLVDEYNLIGLKVGSFRLALSESGAIPVLLKEKLQSNGKLKGIDVLNFVNWETFVIAIEPVVKEACEGQYKIINATDDKYSNIKIYGNHSEIALELGEIKIKVPYAIEVEENEFEDNSKRDINLKSELSENNTSSKRSNLNSITVE